MASDKKTGFYVENTVEVDFNGKKVRVNKFEADLLKDKNTKQNKK